MLFDPDVQCLSVDKLVRLFCIHTLNYKTVENCYEVLLNRPFTSAEPSECKDYLGLQIS